MTSVHELRSTIRLNIVNTGRFSPRILIKSIENGYAGNCLHRLSGRFFNENTLNHKTKSMNMFLDVLMIDHPTDISKDCHQASQIFAQAAVVMNLTGQNRRHFCGLRSLCWQRCEWSVGVFDAMFDNKILTKRQNKVLHQLFSGIKIKPQKFILGPEKSFWNFKIAKFSAWS